MSPAEIGVGCSIIGALLAIATFARLVVSENNRAARQLVIVESLVALRKEIAEAYVTCKVFELYKDNTGERFDGHSVRIARLEDSRRRA